MLAVLQLVFEQLGHEVFTASSAREALAHTEPVDIVFTDVHLPDMGGPELAAHLRATGHTSPIVGITGDAPESVIGLDHVEQKPVPVRRLRELVAEFVQR